MPISAIIKIAGTIPAGVTTNDIASIDIPEDGFIVNIGGTLIAIDASVAAGTNYVISELSFNSTNQISANDGRGTLAGMTVANTFFGTSGGAKSSEIANLPMPEGIPVNSGERIHLHGISSIADLTGSAVFLLYLLSKGGGRRNIRRR